MTVRYLSFFKVITRLAFLFLFSNVVYSECNRNDIFCNEKAEIEGDLSKEESNLLKWDTINSWPFYVSEKQNFQPNKHGIGTFIFEHNYYSEKPDKKMIIFRPFGLHMKDFFCDSKNEKSANDWQINNYLLYPIISCQKTRDMEKFSLFCLLNHEKIREQDNFTERCKISYKNYSFRTVNFELFPFIFYQNSTKSNSYSAVFPLAGELKNKFWRDEIYWTLWPFYLKTRKNDEINRSTPWPFIQKRFGPKTTGCAIWPIFGSFQKEKTYSHKYFLWPLIYSYKDKLDTEDPITKNGFLPFFAKEKSQKVNDITIIWPFFGERNEPDYKEGRIFWPFLVQGRGKVFINRWAPFYTHSIKKGCDKKWYFWPFVKSMAWKESDLYIKQTQFLYFLFLSQQQKSEKSHLFYAEKTHLWPFFSYWNNGNGHIQFQMLSPFEVLLPNNKIVQNLYTPIFSIYRFNQKDDLQTQNLFWNFITEKKTKQKRELTIGPILKYSNEKKSGNFELLKGLLSFSRTENKKSLKLFWFKIF